MNRFRPNIVLSGIEAYGKIASATCTRTGVRLRITQAMHALRHHDDGSDAGRREGR